jgi:integrase
MTTSVHAPFSPAAWHKLIAALAHDDEPAGVVLYALVATGLRVGDILQINRAAFRLAFKNQFLCLGRKAEFLAVPFIAEASAWKRLKATWKRGNTVAEWLCPDCAGDPTTAGFGAYRQLDRHLKVVGKRLKLRGRVHLHRIRRTVAMQQLRTDKDLDRVQKMLGHKSAQATARYR